MFILHNNIVMHSQRGNILFLILLAVVLFAALSYAVTNSIRGGGNDASKENLETQAAQVLQYSSLMENTVQRMVLSGIPVEQLEFYGAGSNNGTNSNCSTNACKVFHAEGGKVPIQPLPQSMAAPGISQFQTSAGDVELGFFIIAVKGIGTSLPDLVMFQRGLSTTLCDKINVKLGVYPEGAAQLADNMGVGSAGAAGISGTDYVAAQGNISPIPVLSADAFGGSDSRITAQQRFCFFRGTPSGSYLVTVLVPR